jgi:hypothetical protein
MNSFFTYRSSSPRCWRVGVEIRKTFSGGVWPRGILDKFVRDIECINPDYFLAFASFVRFSHEENSYMNSSVNSLDDVECG